MQVEFIASVSLISPDPVESRRLYVDALGLPLERVGGEYFASEHIDGSRHFGVWPLSEAAEACFGSADWPVDVPRPQVSIEFEVGSEAAVGKAAAELAGAGHSLLHEARTEPWGQTVARLLSPEGAIVGVSYTPWMHG